MLISFNQFTDIDNRDNRDSLSSWRSQNNSATLEFEEDTKYNVTFVMGCRNLLFVTRESLMTRKYEDLGSAQTVQVVI